MTFLYHARERAGVKSLALEAENNSAIASHPFGGAAIQAARSVLPAGLLRRKRSSQ